LLAGKWMEMKNITLSEVIQDHKAKAHIFYLICGIQAQYKYSNTMKNRSCYREVTNRKGRVKEGS
jgi:hypothetical protein